MRLLQYQEDKETRLGICTNKGILNVKLLSEVLNITAPGSMQELIAMGDEGKELLKQLVHRANERENDLLYLPEDKLQYLPVLDNPEKIICVGLNYRPHAAEAKMQVPDSPVLFSKFNNSLAGHNEEVHLLANAEKYDYEAELVIVIGKQAKHVSQEAALSYVYGYTVGNDFSARDLQMRTGQWLLGKTLDRFAPVGPYLVTADEVNPDNLEISCRVNGKLRQAGNTSDMIFNCASLVSYISQYMTLRPGDLIFTGTPEGVILGYPEEKQVWLKSGDEVEITIEHLGSLRNSLR